MPDLRERQAPLVIRRLAEYLQDLGLVGELPEHEDTTASANEARAKKIELVIAFSRAYFARQTFERLRELVKERASEALSGPVSVGSDLRPVSSLVPVAVAPPEVRAAVAALDAVEEAMEPEEGP